MTKREFLQAVIAIAEVEKASDAIIPREKIVDKTGNMYMEDVTMDTLINFAKEEITKLDVRNASRSSKPTKVQIENESIKAKIVELLTEVGEKYVASAIAEKVEISTQKASALCRQLVDEGKLQVEDVKVPKKGKQKAYSVITE